MGRGENARGLRPGSVAAALHAADGQGRRARGRDAGEADAAPCARRRGDRRGQLLLQGHRAARGRAARPRLPLRRHGGVRR